MFYYPSCTRVPTKVPPDTTGANTVEMTVRLYPFKQLFIDDLEQALYASKIISYTQGFMLMRETAKEVRIIPLLAAYRC